MMLLSYLRFHAEVIRYILFGLDECVSVLRQSGGLGIMIGMISSVQEPSTVDWGTQLAQIVES